MPATVRLVICVACLQLSGCAATMGTYERVGIGAAATAVAGSTLNVVAREVVMPLNERAGRGATAAGTIAVVAGALVAIWALDALLHAEARADLGRSVFSDRLDDPAERRAERQQFRAERAARRQDAREARQRSRPSDPFED